MSLSNPLVSIITPSYNQGRFVEETIQSVLNQTYPYIEYIFVDGGSTDSTMDIVSKYRDKINVIIHEKDNGQADAINKGFLLAKGELVGWINSDDILYSDCVENIVKAYLKFPKGSIFYCSDLDIINEYGLILNSRKVKIKSRDYLLNYNYVLIQQGSFYKRKFIYEIGFLDINNFYCMDLALWLDLLQLGPIIDVSKGTSLSAFRIYDGTKTSTGNRKFLFNIKDVLLEKGSHVFSKNIIVRIYYYLLKLYIKDVFQRFKSIYKK